MMVEAAFAHIYHVARLGVFELSIDRFFVSTVSAGVKYQTLELPEVGNHFCSLLPPGVLLYGGERSTVDGCRAGFSAILARPR